MASGPLIKPKDNKRSPKWPALRRRFLAGKSCMVCGGKKRLEAHHRMPFHLDPSLELDPANLIALCEGKRSINCHLAIGHSFDFRGYNPEVEADAAALAKKLADNRARIKRGDTA